MAKRFPWKDVPGYVVAQLVGGLLAGLALWGIARGVSGFDVTGNLAANGFGDHSPGGYTLGAVLAAEAILTAFFLYVILGVTDDRAPVGFAPLAIGLSLTLIHLIAIPISTEGMVKPSCPSPNPTAESDPPTAITRTGPNRRTSVSPDIRPTSMASE